MAEDIEKLKSLEPTPSLPINPEKIAYFNKPNILDSRYTDKIMELINQYGDNAVSYEYNPKEKRWQPAYYEWGINRPNDGYALKQIGDAPILLRKRDGKYLATRLERPESKKGDIAPSNLETAKNMNDIDFITNRLSYQVIDNHLGLRYDAGNISLDIPLNTISNQAAYELKNYIGSLIAHAEAEAALGNLKSELPYRNDKTTIKIDNRITDFADTTALSTKRLSELMPKANDEKLQQYAQKLTTFINQIYTARKKK